MTFAEAHLLRTNFTYVKGLVCLRSTRIFYAQDKSMKWNIKGMIWLSVIQIIFISEKIRRIRKNKNIFLFFYFLKEDIIWIKNVKFNISINFERISTRCSSIFSKNILTNYFFKINIKQALRFRLRPRKYHK